MKHFRSGFYHFSDVFFFFFRAGLWGIKRRKRPNRSVTMDMDTVTDMEVTGVTVATAEAAIAARLAQSRLKRPRSSLTDRRHRLATTNISNNSMQCNNSSMSYRRTTRLTNGPAPTASTESLESRRPTPTATSNGSETITVSPAPFIIMSLIMGPTQNKLGKQNRTLKKCHKICVVDWKWWRARPDNPQPESQKDFNYSVPGGSWLDIFCAIFSIGGRPGFVITIGFGLVCLVKGK